MVSSYLSFRSLQLGCGNISCCLNGHKIDGRAIKILLQMKLPLLELDVFPIYFFEFERIVVMSKLTCYGIHFNKIDFYFVCPLNI